MDANAVVTFGCRLNAAESDIIRRAAAAAGLAGAVIVNTCAVTAEAERQARQAIRRARRLNPAAPIVVTGCAAELAPERYAAMPEVDRVLGNRAKLLADSYRSLLPSRPEEERVRGIQGSELGPIAARQLAATHPVAGAVTKARGFVEVQHGCDHRCTFCVIPYARGPSRSLPLGAVTQEVQRLLGAGCGEIVLTGVDLTAYGGDLPGRPSLGQLVRRLLKAVPELRRLRLSSLDPAEIDRELWRLVAEEPRLMPHLHLSLQAGDDLILKRMKRRHTRAQAIAAACRARALRPEIALGADLIAGFPTETEAMFSRTLDLVEECGLAFVHVFPYSPRPGTPAARMPPVAAAAIKERAARLRRAADAAIAADLAARVGSETEVLVEQPGLGRAEFYGAVRFGGPHAVGTVRRMRLAAGDGRSLTGVPLA